MRILLILVFSAAFMMQVANADTGPIFEGPQEEIDAINTLFKQWGEARDAGDAEAVAGFYSEDMLIMSRNRALLEGREGAQTFYIENYSEGSNRKLYNAIKELRVLGDMAIVIGRFLVIDEAKGVEDPGYYLIVLRKNSLGEWRIYRDIDTPSPDGMSLLDAQ